MRRVDIGKLFSPSRSLSFAMSLFSKSGNSTNVRILVILYKRRPPGPDGKICGWSHFAWDIFRKSPREVTMMWMDVVSMACGVAVILPGPCMNSKAKQSKAEDQRRGFPRPLMRGPASVPTPARKRYWTLIEHDVKRYVNAALNRNRPTVTARTQTPKTQSDGRPDQKKSKSGHGLGAEASTSVSLAQLPAFCLFPPMRGLGLTLPPPPGPVPLTSVPPPPPPSSPSTLTVLGLLLLFVAFGLVFALVP